MILFYEFLKKYFLQLIILLAMSIIGVLISFAIPFTNKILFDDVLVRRQMTKFMSIIIAYVIFTVINVSMDIIKPIMSAWVFEKFSYDLKIHLVKMIHKNESKETANQGELMTIMNNDIEVIAKMMCTSYINMFYQFFILLCTFISFLIIEPIMIILFVFIVPVYAIFPMIFKKKLSVFTDLVQKEKDKINSTLLEYTNGKNEIKVLKISNWFVDRCKARFLPLVSIVSTRELHRSLANSTLIFYWIGLIITFFIGGRGVIAGSLSIGQLLMLTAYYGQIEFPVRIMVGFINEYSIFKPSALRYISQIRNINNELPLAYAVLDDLPDDAIPNENIKNIKIENMSFGYKNSNSIFKELMMEINENETILIIGESGIGKSTLINLITGLQKPSAGAILINDKYRKGELNMNISLLSQENYLFNCSVFENITFNERGYELDDVIKACKKANAHEFITLMVNGYNSIITNDSLSTGQKKRIALARVFLRNPDVYLLDEPTASLDKKSINLILNALHQSLSGKICIIVAHDFLSYKESNLHIDKIYKIENGRANIVKDS